MQKDWEVKPGQQVAIEGKIGLIEKRATRVECGKQMPVYSLHVGDCVYPFKKDFVYPFEKTARPLWLPRQEDWQEILSKQDSLHAFDDFSRWVNKNMDYPEAMTDNIPQHPAKLYWTVLWCLFVHREVYGLEWDWSENKWVKAK